jgi:AcrR family transcriptional regulator
LDVQSNCDMTGVTELAPNATAGRRAASKARATPVASKVDANAAPTKKVRKSSRAGTDTRLSLLDAAERLFADSGYDGTSLRDIAVRAKQHLALSTYHFGTKERLFEEVVQRRAVEMEAIRLTALAKIDISSISQAEAVRALIEAYTLPMIRARYGSSRQWQAHVRLLSQLISVKRWVPLIRQHYDNCGHQFIQKFEEVLPDTDRDALLDSFSFMISNMLYVCSYTNRFDNMKTHHLTLKDDIQSATNNFLRFAQAGFMALAQAPEAAAAPAQTTGKTQKPAGGPAKATGRASRRRAAESA